MVEQHQKYKLSHQSIQDLLSDIDNKELVIPEIQRPFVWDSGKIRDFIDSLYNFESQIRDGLIIIKRG